MNTDRNENLGLSDKHSEVSDATKELISDTLQLVASQKHTSGIDFASMSDERFGKLMEIVDKDLSNSYNLELKQFETVQKGTFNQKSIKLFGIAGIIFVFLVTILIFIYKQDYLTQWVAVVTAYLGGLGTSAVFRNKKR